MLVFCGCERDEFDNQTGNGGSNSPVLLVDVPCSFDVTPFGGGTSDTKEVKSEDYTNAEMQIKDFWLIQFNGSGKLLASTYHAPELVGNYVQMNDNNSNVSKTKTVWIVANTGDNSGLSYDNLTAQLSASKGEMGISTASDLEVLEKDGYSFTTKSASSIDRLNRADGAILLSGKCSFDAEDLTNYNESEKGIVVRLSAMVAKIKIDYTVGQGYSLNSVNLYRIPEKVSFMRENYTGTTDYTQLPYRYTVTHLVGDNSANSGSIIIYVPQNIQPATSGNSASTKTANAPLKASYISFSVSKGNSTDRVNVNVFPGGNADGQTNQVNNYEIKANAFYKEVINITQSSLDSYLGDTKTDKRLIEEIQVTTTSNCYILNPLTGTGKNDSGFNYAAYREEFYSLPLIARVNEAWTGINNNNVIGASDEWKIEVIWQDVPGRQVYFVEKSGLKAFRNTYGYVENKGSDAANNLLFAREYYGKGNGENGFVGIFVKKECVTDKKDRVRGNVLIGLRKKTGTNSDGSNKYGDILWSWHLWVTDYNPDAEVSTSTYYATVRGDADNSGTRDAKVFHYKYFNDFSPNYKWIMDRHLGAMGWRPMGMFGTPNHDGASPEPRTVNYVENTNHIQAPEAFGLYYQWGRKDPVPANDLMYNSEYINNADTGMETYYKKYYSSNVNNFVEMLKGYVQDLWDITGSIQKSTSGSESILKVNASFSNIWDTHKSPTSMGADIYTSSNISAPWGHPSSKTWPSNTSDTKIVGTYTSTQGSKSLFDPCPAGWEVPDSKIAYKGLYGGYNSTKYTGGHYLAKGYANVFHDVDSETIITYGADNRQAHINNGAWEIRVDGSLSNSERVPTYEMVAWENDSYRSTTADKLSNHVTFYPPAGFVTYAGRKDMGGIGDVWGSDVFNTKNGGYLYLGRSVGNYPKNGETSSSPSAEWRTSGAALYHNHTEFGVNHAFSVRCVKKQ